MARSERIGRTRAVMLDWDGTLIHSLPLKIDNAGRLFAARYGAAATDVRASYARHSGIPRRRLFDRIAGDCIGRGLEEAEFAELSRAFSEANRTRIRGEGRLRSGTLEALRVLREEGCLLFVSTSAAQDEMQPLAEHFGVDACTDGLFGSRPGFSKGAEHVAYVCRQHRLTPDAMAGVGDDAGDMDLFLDAGIAPVGITGTLEREALFQAGAARVIDALPELVGYVRGGEASAQ